MSNNPGGTDPLISAWFGVETGDTLIGAFRECGGLGSQNDVVEYKASRDGKFIIQKVPGRLKWNNITLKRGITDSMDMWRWRKLVEEGNMASARKNISIIMYNTANQAVAQWDLTGVWPTKISGPSANAANNEVAIEELELTCERYERVN